MLVGAAGLVLAAITVAGVLHVRELNAPKPIAALPAESVAVGPTAVAPHGPADPQPTAPRDLPPLEKPASAPELPAAAPVPAPTVDPVALKTARRSVNIVMYTTTWCPQCKRAKAWMSDNDVAYTEHDIEASPQAMRDCKKLNPKCSIPTMDIDGEVVIGFGAETLRATVDRAARRHLH